MSKQSLQDKSIVIIGGTTGLGLSAAHACVNAGACVTIVGRNPDSADTALESLGHNARALSADATDSQTAAHAIQLAVDSFGKLDALYHVAGGSGRSAGDGPLHTLSDEGIDFTLRLNQLSVIYSNRAAVLQFLDQESPGSILNMTSVLANSPSPHFFATHIYAAAKAAIVGLTKAAAAHYAPQNIRFNAIAPALVATPMSDRAQHDDQILDFIKTKQPLDSGRIGDPSDLDAAVVFFLSDESRFVTGQTLAVDGGWSVSEGQVPQ